MKITRVMSRAGFSLCIVGVAFQFVGCSSVPKPAEADGRSRVPVNDESRVQALQQRVSADRELLTENNLLRAQVNALQAKLTELTSIVREALMLPTALQPQTPPAPAPQPPATAPQSMGTPDLSSYAYTANSFGVVIRVPHKFARTEFEPSEQVAQALRVGVRGAERIDVRGYTDSRVVNPIDRLIAIERAQKARTWLLNNGADATKIHTKSYTAGHFLVENKTCEGRSMNRRVEVEIRNKQLGDQRVASST